MRSEKTACKGTGITIVSVSKKIDLRVMPRISEFVPRTRHFSREFALHLPILNSTGRFGAKCLIEHPENTRNRRMTVADAPAMPIHPPNAQ